MPRPLPSSPQQPGKTTIATANAGAGFDSARESCCSAASSLRWPGSASRASTSGAPLAWANQASALSGLVPVCARPAGRHRRRTRRLPNADRSPSQSCDHVLAHRYSASASEARARPLTAGLTTARPARSRSEPLPIRPHRRSAAGRYSGQGPDGPRPCGPDVQPGRGRRNETGTSKVIATRGGDHLSSYGGPGVKG